jgi:hypothetical protein
MANSGEESPGLQAPRPRPAPTFQVTSLSDTTKHPCAICGNRKKTSQYTCLTRDEAAMLSKCFDVGHLHSRSRVCSCVFVPRSDGKRFSKNNRPTWLLPNQDGLNGPSWQSEDLPRTPRKRRSFLKELMAKRCKLSIELSAAKHQMSKQKRLTEIKVQKLRTKLVGVNEDLRHYLSNKNQNLQATKDAELSKAHTELNALTENVVTLTDTNERLLQTLRTNEDKLLELELLKKAMAVVQSECQTLKDQLSLKKQKLGDLKNHHFHQINQNAKYRQYYIRVSSESLDRIFVLLQSDLDDIARTIRHKRLKNGKAVLYLFIECLHRGDQPWIEIARRWGYKTGPAIKRVFTYVLESFDRKVTPVYLYLQTLDEIKNQLGSLPVRRPCPLSPKGVKVPRINGDGTPALGCDDNPVYRTLLDDLEDALKNTSAVLLVDGMPLPIKQDSTQLGRRLQYSAYKHRHILQSLLIVGLNRLYQFRSPLHGGTSSENYDMWATSRLEALLVDWVKESSSSLPGLIGDAAFAPRTAQLLVKGLHLYTTKFANREPSEVLTATEASFVRSLQSLRAPVEHLVGALTGPAGWNILHKPCKDLNQFERILNCCMAVNNIETIVRTQNELRKNGSPQACGLWEPSPLETRHPWQSTANFAPLKIPRPWKPPKQPSPMHPLSPAVFSLLASMTQSRAFDDLSASKRRYGIDTQHNLSQKTESRADEAQAGGGLRYTEFGRFSASPGYFLVGRCSASAKDLTYFSTLMFDENHNLLRHNCTCQFGGRGEPKRANKLTEILAILKANLLAARYLPELNASELAACNLDKLKAHCLSLGLLSSGRKADLLSRLLNPQYPTDYRKANSNPLLSKEQLLKDIQSTEDNIAALYADIDLAPTPWCAHQFLLFMVLHTYCATVRNKQTSKDPILLGIASQCPPAVRHQAKKWPWSYFKNILPELGSYWVVAPSLIGSPTSTFGACVGCEGLDSGVQNVTCPECERNWHPKCARLSPQDLYQICPDTWKCPACCRHDTFPTGPQRQFENYGQVEDLIRQLAARTAVDQQTRLFQAKSFLEVAGAADHHITGQQTPHGLIPNTLSDEMIDPIESALDEREEEQ